MTNTKVSKKTNDPSKLLATHLRERVGACQAAAALTSLIDDAREEMIQLLEGRGEGQHELDVGLALIAIMADIHLTELWDAEQRSYYDDLMAIARLFTLWILNGGDLPQTAVDTQTCWNYITARLK